MKSFELCGFHDGQSPVFQDDGLVILKLAERDLCEGRSVRASAFIMKKLASGEVCCCGKPCSDIKLILKTFKKDVEIYLVSPNTWMDEGSFIYEDSFIIGLPLEKWKLISGGIKMDEVEKEEVRNLNKNCVSENRAFDEKDNTVIVSVDEKEAVTNNQPVPRNLVSEELGKELGIDWSKEK